MAHALACISLEGFLFFFPNSSFPGVGFPRRLFTISLQKPFQPRQRQRQRQRESPKLGKLQFRRYTTTVAPKISFASISTSLSSLSPSRAQLLFALQGPQGLIWIAPLSSLFTFTAHHKIKHPLASPAHTPPCSVLVPWLSLP